MKNATRLSNRLLTSLLFSLASATLAGASPVYFPVYDPFTDATASGGTSYAAGATLAGQTNALGSFWFGIDTGGTAANSAFLSNNVISYPGVPPGPGGNALVLRNVAGPGARIFVATNASGFITGTTANPIACFYSMVLQVSNLASLSTTGTYAIGLGDQSVIANQSSQPGTVAARLYFQKVNGTNYNLGISKMGNTVNYSGPFTTNQTLFVVVDYEGAAATGQGSSDIVRLWINPAANTFGNSTQPTETVNDNTGSDLTPYISCLQFYNLSTANANQLLITDFRMGTNWAWATGGPYISQQPPAVANIGGGMLNLSVGALNNGSANGYQWQFNGANLTNGPSISGSGATVSGALTANLTINNTTALDAGNYSVIVTNAIGSVTSSNSVASAYTFPVITVEPSPTNVMFYAGGSNNLSLSMTELGVAPITNYVYSNSTLIAAATNQSFTIGNLQTSVNFYAVASNLYGAATSSVVSVTVVPEPAAPYPVAVLGDHPIGFWPLNEGTNGNPANNDGVTAFDYAGANNGVYSNVTLGFPGYGQGLASEYGYNPPTDTNTSAQFGASSTDSYAGQIPNINFGSFGTAPSFSIEAWANANGQSQTSGASIINKGYGGGGEQFVLDYFNSTGWRFYIRNSFGTVTTAAGTNGIDSNWHHLAGVLDAAHSNITLYVDGLAQTKTAFTAANGLLSSTNAVAIGSRMSSSTSDFNDNFNGNIQNVAIYNYALTAAQVANHYDAAGTGPGITIPSAATVEEGTTLTVSSVVIGSTPLTYQWYDVTSGNPGTAIAGQTSATLVINNITAAAYNGHLLELTATNAFASGSSATIYLTVNSGPPFSLAIAPSSFTGYAGQPVAFTVTAQGSEPFYYQWSTNGTDVSGATSSVFTNITLLGGSTVGCVVSNTDGVGSPDPITASVTGIAAPTDLYGVHVLGDQPIAYWRLDEPADAATANDYVGGHNAVYINAVTGLPGFSPLYPSETAAGFGMDGVTTDSMAEESDNTGSGISFVDLSTQGANAEFSVETWIQVTPQTSADLLNKGYPNNTQFALDTGAAGGAFRFVVHNGVDTLFSANSGSVMPDGNWHHLVGVCDEANGSVYLYADGVLKNKSSMTAGTGLLSLANSTYPVIIGAQEAQNGSSFTGLTNSSMSQVAIYGYALSSNQVAAHYAIGVAGLVSLTIQNSGNNTVLISWPATNGYFLQQTTSLNPSSWSSVATAPAIIGGSSQVQLPVTGAAQFFRLAPQ